MSRRRHSGRNHRKRTPEPFLEKGLQLLAVASDRFGAVGRSLPEQVVYQQKAQP